MEYGILTVLPLLIMLVLVVTTKRIFESILIPIALVFIMKDGVHFITGFVDEFYNVMAEGTYPWIMLMLTLFGAFIALLINSGGISGFKRFATRYIRSERSSLVFTWVLGMVLFIDDYINNLGIGPTVREITDEHGVPREQIAFSVCCTGTPVCALVPLTAFAVFVFGVMKENGISAEGSSMFTEYIKVIPFMFYPIAIIIIALLLAVGVFPRVGAFKRYYNEIKNGTYSLTQAEKDIIDMENNEDMEITDGGKVIDFALPVLVLVVAMFITSDLVLSVILGIFTSFIMYIPRKRMSFSNFFKSFFEGINDMIYILIIVLMTFVFVYGLEGIGFNEYVIKTVEPIMVGGAIPALTFITVGVVAFLGVDYWAVMLLIAPIAVPLAVSFDVSPYMTIAAVVSGSVFGGTACFFAEQILMVSQSVKRPPVKVAIGGLPYSLTGFVLTVILYLIFGFLL